MNVDHLIETCVPGGDLCDPQVVADNIRRYMEQADPYGSILDDLKYSLQELSVIGCDPDAIGCAKHAIQRAIDTLQSIARMGLRPNSTPPTTLPTEPGYRIKPLEWVDRQDIQRDGVFEALEPVPSGWISVEERLPEEGVDILATNGEAVWPGLYIEGSWWEDNGDWIIPSVITHWQPMPEPPKEERE